MRSVIFIGSHGCGLCEDVMANVVMPLMARYPRNVSAHIGGWDMTTERINRRRRITRVPLFVVENDGEEEFRFSGRLSIDQLEGIVLCDDDVLTLNDALGVV